MSGSETVVITGFGPFRQFWVNPSWRAAQDLKLCGLGERIEVHIKEIPVSYVQSQHVIAEIWQTLNPKFVVHLGVARGCRVVILEQTAKNSGYRDRDVCGFCPESHCCVNEGPETLCSVVNMLPVSKLFRKSGMDVLCSRDAGRFLCEFTYYCSLYHGQGRAALIHIPTHGRLASADRLLPLLKSIIQTMLSQMDDDGRAEVVYSPYEHTPQSKNMQSLNTLHEPEVCMKNILKISTRRNEGF
ncbi:pyroglutamyl-peptidase 1-like [Solea senegalensis]|uniref:Pyroglutamyl-peptidase 1-like n=1 Tax=Solea senegalensis TaxID=28829 RepID=A0AAV6SY23_SOLSE|nr:pyroglutamyl-peptidase 1-like [Solea senegalensis]